jgi:hypothetical protein
VHGSRLCTSTYRDVFCSYRAEGPGAGRMVGVIRMTRPPGLRPLRDSPADLPRRSPRAARG